MKRISIAVLVVMMAAAPGPVSAQDAGTKAITVIYRRFAGVMAVVYFTLDTSQGSREMMGTGVCVSRDAQGRAIFLTTALRLQVRRDDMKNFRLSPSGPDGKTVAAELMGIDPATSFAFLRTSQPQVWPHVTFDAPNTLAIGQQVVSVGLLGRDTGYASYLGVAHVAGKIHIPETLYHVTGGRLTGVCSPVFNLAGKAVGIVDRQLPLTYQMLTGRAQPVLVALTGREDQVFFLPVEEFTQAIENIPTASWPPRRAWMGVLNFVPISQESANTFNVNSPAVLIGQVIPEMPAAKAGLKNRDIITGLNGRPLEKFATPALVVRNFLKQLQRVGAGGQITLTVLRDAKEFSAAVTLAPVPTEAHEARRYFAAKLGVVLRGKVTMDRYRDLSPTATVQGLVVLQVVAGGSADQGRLKRGDLVTSVNGQPVSTTVEASRLIEKSLKDSPKKTIVLLVQRGSEVRPISILPPTR